MCLGSFLLGMVLGTRARTVETHPVGPTPIPTPPDADRLAYYCRLIEQLPASDRIVAILELHRDRVIHVDTACALIDEVA